MNQPQTIFDARREGRAAFQQHGVTGISRHSYEARTELRAGFLAGFTEAQHAAHERALDDALAYHQLSVRDNTTVRAWANRLAQRSA
jgi:hypothetical protein